ncbi:hypothetical protein BXZ70DRAFT_395387 [Cristinia sonorae]|uniref:Uncharacterized protein n=1 Tax=Cristinia sonorae TaxID=1940300 RepID=A0A8K0XTM6_9AGAR|nr:hypothetical protein BXZ70DRAFT_395387 [Cristinia sonorae]
MSSVFPRLSSRFPQNLHMKSMSSPISPTSSAVLVPLPWADHDDCNRSWAHVDPETVDAILRHDLPAAELYKLDTRRILESQWHIIDLQDSTVSFRSVPSAGEIYQTLDSLLIPLNIYFSILSVHALSAGQPIFLPTYFFQYINHLVKISSQYQWDAVLLYHFAFFARRCSEMLGGDYKGWARIDIDLMEELLIQHRKMPEAPRITRRK